MECPLPAEEPAGRLTGAGLEVEGVIYRPRPAGVITARILSVEPHPAADRLTVCRVSDGARDYTVARGAPNVRAGETAPFAAVGTRLPGGIAIRKAKAARRRLEGMLCSERELGPRRGRRGDTAPRPRLPGGHFARRGARARRLAARRQRAPRTVPTARRHRHRAGGLGALRVPLRVAPRMSWRPRGPPPAPVSVERRPVPPLHGASRRGRRAAGPVPVPRVAAARPLGRAGDQRDRGRDELRDARIRPAAPRIRFREDRGGGRRGARGEARRADRHDRREGAGAPRGDARHRRCPGAGRRRGADGRRGERGGAGHRRGAARERLLRPGDGAAGIEGARALQRFVVPVRAGDRRRGRRVRARPGGAACRRACGGGRQRGHPRMSPDPPPAGDRASARQGGRPPERGGRRAGRPPTA